MKTVTYYDKQLWAQHDAAVRTAVVVDGKVTVSFVWQPGGNIKDYDGPDPNNCQTVEDLLKHGYKRRRYPPPTHRAGTANRPE